MKTLEIPEPLIFEWDSGNQNKSLEKHGITNREAEQVFLNFNIIFEDAKHSNGERRFTILGQSDDGKLIFSAFTARFNKVRIISSRSASRKERQIYEKTFQENT